MDNSQNHGLTQTPQGHRLNDDCPGGHRDSSEGSSVECVWCQTIYLIDKDLNGDKPSEGRQYITCDLCRG